MSPARHALELDRALVWLRRDLRADDHAALHHALRAARQVWCVFVFDRDILDPLPRADRRVEFIRDSLVGARRRAARAGRVARRRGRRPDRAPRPRRPARSPALARRSACRRSTPTTTTSPHALARDAQVRGALADVGVALHTSKDHVVFERDEVLTQAGSPFSVFTPYKNAWLKKLTPYYLQRLPGGPPRRRAGAAAAGRRAPACRRWPRSASSPPTCTSCAAQRRRPARQELLDDFLRRASTTTTRRATSRPSRARAT